jgi:hypothetical protein
VIRSDPKESFSNYYINKIAPFFSDWKETLIWSCLQGCMGYAIANNNENPTAVQIAVGDFCFFAGMPNEELILYIFEGESLCPIDLIINM